MARRLAKLLSHGLREMRATTADVNGGVAMLFWSGNELVATGAIDIADERIQELRFIVNPDKLAYLQRRLGDSGAGSR